MDYDKITSNYQQYQLQNDITDKFDIVYIVPINHTKYSLSLSKFFNPDISYLLLTYTNFKTIILQFWVGVYGI